jgi:rhamnulose-1-phosphate aldolase
MKNIVEQNPALNELLSQVAEIAQYLWQRGWAERNAGNISVNITHLVSASEFNNVSPGTRIALGRTYPELASCFFMVTGTGKRMRDLAKQPLHNALIIQVSEDGSSYRGFADADTDKNLKPTSELPSHLGIHQLIAQRGTPEKVILHTHASELVALTQHPQLKDADTINNILWGMHPETAVFIPKGVGFVPYIMPGSEEIATQTLLQLAKHDIVLWEKHGVFAIGNNVLDCFDNIDIACKSAHIYLTCKAAGFEPEGMKPHQLEALRNYVI